MDQRRTARGDDSDASGAKDGDKGRDARVGKLCEDRAPVPQGDDKNLLRTPYDACAVNPGLYGNATWQCTGSIWRWRGDVLRPQS